MLKNQPLNQITQSLALNDELLAAIEKIEFLSDLLESQNSYMSHLEKLIFTLFKELELVNDELADTLLLGVSFNEAKVLAKSILKGKKSSCESVAQLLCVLYGKVVTPEDLKDKFTIASVGLPVTNIITLNQSAPLAF